MICKSYVEHVLLVQAGRTLLHWAAAEDASKAVKKIVGDGGQTEQVKQLLESRTHGGNTPLLRASAYGSDEASKILLERGADVNARNNENCTPLIRAARWGHTSTIEVLLRYGAAPDCQDQNGNTAMDWAKRKEFDEVLTKLQEANRKSMNAESSAANSHSTTDLTQQKQRANPSSMNVTKTQSISASGNAYASNTTGQSRIQGKQGSTPPAPPPPPRRANGMYNTNAKTENGAIAPPPPRDSSYKQTRANSQSSKPSNTNSSMLYKQASADSRMNNQSNSNNKQLYKQMSTDSRTKRQSDLDNELKKQVTGATDSEQSKQSTADSATGISESEEDSDVAETREVPLTRRSLCSTGASAVGPMRVEGWLSKHGHVIRNWKNRWFVLESRTMWYYAKKGESRSKAKGVIRLDKNASVYMDSTVAKPNRFIVKTSEKTYEMQAADEEEADDWVAAIQNNLNTVDPDLASRRYDRIDG